MKKTKKRWINDNENLDKKKETEIDRERVENGNTNNKIQEKRKGIF
jgi:hypothetical protein